MGLVFRDSCVRILWLISSFRQSISYSWSYDVKNKLFVFLVTFSNVVPICFVLAFPSAIEFEYVFLRFL